MLVLAAIIIIIIITTIIISGNLIVKEEGFFNLTYLSQQLNKVKTIVSPLLMSSIVLGTAGKRLMKPILP